MFELEAVPESWTPQVHIDLRIVQCTFDAQLRLATEHLVHLARLNSKLFSLGEYVLSPV